MKPLDFEVRAEDYCGACSGSGEGRHDGSSCRSCCGTGMESNKQLNGLFNKILQPYDALYADYLALKRECA